jgi:hypothetical protein
MQMKPTAVGSGDRLGARDLAVQELSALMEGEIPKTRKDFRRAILLASIMGQTIMEHQNPSEYICSKCGLRHATGEKIVAEF